MLQALKRSGKLIYRINLKKVAQIGAILVWLFLLAGSYGYAIMYSTTPGARETVPKHWPAETKLKLASPKYTLVTFIHPKCTCSRATLRELCRIVSTCGLKLQTVVVMLVPQGLPEDWAKGELYETANQIPGTRVILDMGGQEAKIFNCLTSGHSLLYNNTGTLLFDGGITPSRGHEGDNVGKNTIEDLVRNRHSQTKSNQVFGCPLRERK